MSQLQGAFGAPDFTICCPFSLGARFENYETFIYLIFNVFRLVVNRGYGISEYGGTTVFFLYLTGSRG
jgi:hypothetical protein